MQHPFALFRTWALSTALSICLGVCAAQGAPGQFGVALGQKLQTERLAEVDLAGVSTLVWDELFIFDPRSSKEGNCRLLQLSYFDCFTTFPATVRDDEHILVFRRNAKVVRVERHSRKNGDFVSAAHPRPQPVKRSAATFAVIQMPAAAGAAAPGFRLDHKP